jgi:hypothetical protein
MSPPLTPPRSPLIDEVWHAHILCTKDYRQFCFDVFGEYLDHLPGTAGFNWEYYDITMTRYHARFGAVPPGGGNPEYRREVNCEIWPSSEDLEEMRHSAQYPDGCGSCG